MIIMFRGTSVSKNMAPQVLSLYATVNAVKYNRKTLVLQFMNKFPVEKILRGQRDSESAIIDRGTFTFNDSGMDYLIRTVHSQRLDKDNFLIGCTGMFKSKNMLDVAAVSAKPEFVSEIMARPDDAINLIKSAKEIYDDIYILGDGKAPELCKALNPLVDISIICIPQGNKEEVEEIQAVKEGSEDNEKNDFLYMITEFDNRSTFGVTRMKKTYDVKRIAILPYNTGFKDACNSENVLAYALTNIDVKENDVNYNIFYAVFDVMHKIMNNEEMETPQFNYRKFEQTPDEEKTPRYIKLDSTNVRYTKKYRGMLWWKTEEDGYEVALDEFSDEETFGYDEEQDMDSDDDYEKFEFDEDIGDDDGEFNSIDDDEEDYFDDTQRSLAEIDDISWDDAVAYDPEAAKEEEEEEIDEDEQYVVEEDPELLVNQPRVIPLSEIHLRDETEYGYNPQPQPYRPQPYGQPYGQPYMNDMRRDFRREETKDDDIDYIDEDDLEEIVEKPKLFSRLFGKKKKLAVPEEDISEDELEEVNVSTVNTEED